MDDFDLQLQLAQQRRQRFAQQLAGAQDAPQGKMVGNVYVPPNALQYAAQALRGIGAMRGEQMAGDEIAQINRQRQQAMADTLRQFGQMSQGRPADVLPDDQQGPVRPAQAPDLQGAFGMLADSPFQQFQQAGFQGSMQLGIKEAERRQAGEQQQRFAQIMQNSSPQEAIAAGVPSEMVEKYHAARNFGREKVEFKDVGGQLVPVTQYGERPEGVQPIDKTGNPFSDLVIRDPATGQIVPNRPVADTKVGIARAGRPQVNVDARSFNTQENEQSKAYGKTLGELRGRITTQGFEAPAKLAKLSRMEQLLSGIEGGALSPAMADVASALNSLGVKVDPKLGNKAAAEALAIQMALDMREPGSGPMTDKDFDNFLKSVPSLAKSAEGRALITQTMRAAIQRDLEAAQFARQYARQNNGVIDDNFFDTLAQWYAERPVVTPSMPPTNARSQPFQEPSKEQRYQEWLRQQQGGGL